VRRRDVLLASAAGVLAALLIGFIPSLIPGPVAEYLLAPAIDVWFAAPVLVLVAFVLRNRPPWDELARAIGVVGVAWVAFVVAFYVLLVIVFMVVGPIGY